jgi:hypothetical protein
VGLAAPALIVLLALDVGMMFSALNVQYHDIGHALPVRDVDPDVRFARHLSDDTYTGEVALNPMVGIDKP